jgi:hypothetical protein
MCNKGFNGYDIQSLLNHKSTHVEIYTNQTG